MIFVRYADDFVAGFQRRRDAERFLADLRDRFAPFGLELHPDKTRLIEFGRFAANDRKLRGLGTDKKRMRAKRRSLKVELRRRMHLPIGVQGAWLRSVLTGHLNYYGVPGNSEALATFRFHLVRDWWAALRRRGGEEILERP